MRWEFKFSSCLIMSLGRIAIEGVCFRVVILSLFQICGLAEYFVMCG